MDREAAQAFVPSVPYGAGEGRWSVLGAVAFVAAVMGAAVAATFVMAKGYQAWRGSLDAARAATLPAVDDPVVMIALQLAGQLLELGLIWWLAGLGQRNRTAALNLQPVHLAFRQWIGIMALLVVVKITATVVAGLFERPDVGSELGPFLALARSPRAWVLFLAAVVLAGLVEELLFRGVLSRTLEGTRLGFWLGAGIASAGFAALHLQYGFGGQIVIFAIGMTLAWIRAWSGSLWPAVAAHAFNNAAALLAMRAIS